jgi:hypothetical protein
MPEKRWINDIIFKELNTNIGLSIDTTSLSENCAGIIAVFKTEEAARKNSLRNGGNGMVTELAVEINVIKGE